MTYKDLKEDMMKWRELHAQRCWVRDVFGLLREMQNVLWGWREAIRLKTGDLVIEIGESHAKELVLHKSVYKPYYRVSILEWYDVIISSKQALEMLGTWTELTMHNMKGYPLSLVWNWGTYWREYGGFLLAWVITCWNASICKTVVIVPAEDVLAISHLVSLLIYGQMDLEATCWVSNLLLNLCASGLLKKSYHLINRHR